MPIETNYPGVYVQEIPDGTRGITGVSTAITAFVGCLSSGPIGTPVRCLSFAEFEQAFGAPDPDRPTGWQVQQFFLNGGGEAWVSRLSATAYPPTGSDIAGNEIDRTGIYALAAMQLVNLIVVPDMPAMDASSFLIAATAVFNYAVERRAFVVLDLPATIASPDDAEAWAKQVPASFGTGITNGATYFPQVCLPQDGSAEPLTVGASGTMAGVYAATDASRGVWKAPAGIETSLAGVSALSFPVTNEQNGDLNLLGINALRTFPVYGNTPWGARTLASPNQADEDWKYIPVRRLALYIEQSLIQGLQWVVFEPNDAVLWSQIRLSVSAFLETLFRQGAFAGETGAQSYQCICDESTTTPQDMDDGIVNVLILFAPVKPAEFVVISLQFMTAQTAT